jgi:hypothetical protein
LVGKLGMLPHINSVTSSAFFCSKTFMEKNRSYRSAPPNSRA